MMWKKWKSIAQAKSKLASKTDDIPKSQTLIAANLPLGLLLWLVNKKLYQSQLFQKQITLIRSAVGEV